MTNTRYSAAEKHADAGRSRRGAGIFDFAFWCAPEDAGRLMHYAAVILSAWAASHI